MNRKAFLLSIVFLLSMNLTCFAQETSIVGTVTDTSGAVVPGAKVTVQNPAKGFMRHLTTNSAGAYVAASVPIGTYVIMVEASGFQRLVRTGILLQVGAVRRVDVQLKVGSLAQQVTVQAAPLHVQTDTPELSSVITGREIANLNLNGRDYLALTLLVPGASPAHNWNPTQAQVANNINVSFNGDRNRENNVLIDGVPNADEGTYEDLDTFPSLDSIAEFRVATQQYGAEMGKMGATQIEVATKSGTREFHGDAYDYVRNDAFDANPFFQNRVIAPPGGNAPKTPLQWNDFGYTIGGPFYIPHRYNTGRSKTFFFWSQEWHDFNQGNVFDARVPTSLMRQGDFSQCDSTSADFIPLLFQEGCRLPKLKGKSYDTVQAMPGFSPQAFGNAADLLNAYIPLPNNGLNTYTHSGVNTTRWWQGIVRVDQNISDKTSLYFRGIRESTNFVTLGDTYGTLQTPHYYLGLNGVVHLVHTFNPTLMTDAMAGAWNFYQRWTNEASRYSLAGTINKPSNFAMNHIFAVNDANPLLPGVHVAGGLPFFFTANAGPVPYENAAPTYALRDDTTKVIGSQTLKFGFYFEKYDKNMDYQTGPSTQGMLSFGAGGPVSAGNGLANMFLGRIQGYNESVIVRDGVPVPGYGRAYWRMTDFEPYLQDNWRATSKLTLNFGLRYYFWTPQHDIQNPPVDGNFLPNLYNPALQAQLDANGNLIPGSGYNFTEYGNGLVNCGRNGIPAGCTNLSKLNFGPRFGFAYDPFGHGTTVIRGGYGIYYSDTSEAGAEGMGGNPPVALNPTGSNIIGYTNIVPGVLGPFYGFVAIPANETFPSVQQYSLSVQHMFSGRDLLAVAYVGTLGRHNDLLYDMNQVPLGLSTVNVPVLANTSAVNGLTTNPNPVPMCDAAGNCNVQELLTNGVVPETFFRPYRGYGELDMNPLGANSNYNALQVEFRHAFSHGLTFQTSYTWSHELDETSSDSSGTGVDDSHLSRWYGTGDLNRNQMLVLNYIYDVPLFTHSGHAPLREALGGWRISGITTFYSGEPVNVSCGISGFNTGIGEGVQCNTVGPVRVKKGVFDDPQFGPTVTWFDPSVVTQPAASQLFANNEPGMFGYMGRNVLTGPGRNNWDLALLKDFKLPWVGGEGSTLQFRVETFNSFNTTQWSGIAAGCNGDPNSDGSPAFGRSCGGTQYNLGNGEVTGAYDPRIMQLALKLIF
jgi:hypothetical protein